MVISAAGREMAARLMQLVSGATTRGEAEPLTGGQGGGDARKALEAWCADRPVDDDLLAR